tara:strand:- start:413 stop:526 length:114 start_codon:yes stop_codon:yes gene_type:complete
MNLITLIIGLGTGFAAGMYVLTQIINKINKINKGDKS